MLQDKVNELKEELKLYEALIDDYVVKRIPVTNVMTDAVYNQFCRMHPEVDVSQRKFTRLLCEELGLKSVQSRLDGRRGSFYEHK